jgi:SAM-dependent methyltransferase
MLSMAFAAATACAGTAPSAGDAPVNEPALPESSVIPYEEVGTLLQVPQVQAPQELTASGDRRAAWHHWLERHRADLDARLLRGDEDSIVNLMLYGTTFTSVRRTTPQDLSAAGGELKSSEILDRRLEDLARGLLEPGANERLVFARQVLERRGIVLSGAAGAPAVRKYLGGIRARTIEEGEKYRARLEAANAQAREADKLTGYATAYHDRGLSSDTSIRVDFALERILEELRSRGTLVGGGVRRAAIVGPGLDFADKAEGHDFYPQQTIQPFALLDSLLRLELSGVDDLRVTAFDVSPRVIQHLAAARTRARAGRGYLVHLPLAPDTPSREWNPQLVAYWRRFGDQVGEAATPAPLPESGGEVNIRAVDVGPRSVLSIVPHQLDVVIERIDRLPAGEQFDLVVATNVLLYYDVFEQTLAVANIARMLKPGGLLIANHAVVSTTGFERDPHLVIPVPFERQRIGSAPFRLSGDTFYCYRRLE